MKPKSYEILLRAVEEGVRLGVSRAHKHVDNPTLEQLQTAVEDAVMAEICEWFSFEDELS